MEGECRVGCYCFWEPVLSERVSPAGGPGGGLWAAGETGYLGRVRAGNLGWGRGAKREEGPTGALMPAKGGLRECLYVKVLLTNLCGCSGFRFRLEPENAQTKKGPEIASWPSLILEPPDDWTACSEFRSELEAEPFQNRWPTHFQSSVYMLPSLLQFLPGHPPPSSSLRWACLATIQAFHQESGKGSVPSHGSELWSLTFQNKGPNICTRASENRHLFSPHSLRFSVFITAECPLKK